MARYVSGSDLESMIEHALERQLTSEATMRRIAGVLATPGRPWARQFIAVLDARRPGAPAESEWERRVFDELRRRGVLDLERQWAVELPGYGRVRFDMAIPALRWALEIDVHPAHRSLDGVAKDNERDAAAARHDWSVTRVAELQLTQALDRTLDTIVATVARRRALSAVPGPR